MPTPRLRRAVKIVAYLALGAFLLVLAGAGYLYHRVRSGVYGTVPDRLSVLRYAEEPPAAPPEPPVAERPFDFDPAAFREPDRRFGPFTRWWWPGNDVERAELEREVGVLAEAGFAGVEVQPFTMGLDPDAPEAERARVLSWDEESFYENLRVVLEAALEAGLVVDLNDGSGWPTGGPQVALEDNFRTLLYTETDASGGGEVRWEPEPPAAPLSAYLTYALNEMFGAPTAGIHFPDAAELQAVIAARVVEDGRSRWIWNVSDQVRLDAASATDVTDHVADGVLSWSAPEGDWRLIAFWSLPDGESPSLIAREEPGFVLDHFDPPRVRANYDYLLGTRTGLAPYYGRPLRAVFNDSYEFKAERHHTRDFLEAFEERRGYDLRPWLPAVLKPGYNHVFAHMMLQGAKPDFVFSDEDWRLRHDYDLTLSELLLEGFLETSADWMGRRGLLHRTQAYGMPMDVIGASGRAQIPEAEQLYWGGSEAFLKAVSSGAHLYGRPITTAESVVYMGRAYMTTPQKIKLSVDKAFTAGINQVIYHGTAYRYETPGFGDEGWYPWSSPHFSFMNFSSDLREANVFWKHVPALNAYVTRAQYALRSGAPSADVLVYYPFLGFTMGQEVLNPEELLPRGHFEGVEPAVAQPMDAAAGAVSAESRWFALVWDLVNALEEQGVTWEWVNDESLLAATLEGGRFAIRDQRYPALVLPHLPHMALPTASHLDALAAQGAAIVLLGEPPRRQAGFHDWEQRDREVAAHFEGIAAADTTVALADASRLADWTGTLARPIRFAEPYRHLRQIRRVMEDGSQVLFLRSKADAWTRVGLELDPAFRHALWLDPTDGAAYAARGGSLAWWLPPWGSIVLYASTRPATSGVQVAETPPLRPADGAAVAGLDRWNLRAGGVERSRVALADWREDEGLRAAASGVYETTFTLTELPGGSRYLLDLGQVFFTAEVTLNGQAAGETLFAPHVLDVTDLVRAGENAVTVSVTATQLNGLIARGAAGDERYRQYEAREAEWMPAGLVGPVQLWEIEAQS